MKVCCGNGKPYDTLTDFERLGGCSTDQCVGPIELEEYFLSSHITFNTNECISYEDVQYLFKTEENKNETTRN